MKNILYTLVAISISIHAMAQMDSDQGKFILSGELIGKNTGWLILGYWSADGTYKSDTTFAIHGKFSFKGNVGQPELAFLTGDIKSKSADDPNFTDLYIEPGTMSIVLTPGDFKHAKITGSKTQDERQALENHPVYRKIDLLSEYDDAARDSLTKYPGSVFFQKKHDSLITALRKLEQNRKDIELRFIVDHPHSYLSINKLWYYSDALNPDTLSNIYDGLDDQIQHSSVGKIVAQKLAGQPGQLAPVFATVDRSGDSISLSSYKGNKYVLLVFWASWCVPCREEVPYLAKLYAAYHQRGLEIIGVANDDNIQKWKKAIADDNTGMWHQVLQGYRTQNDIGKLYGVMPIPLTFLIDKDGLIVGRYNKIEPLDAKLKVLFQ